MQADKPEAHKRASCNTEGQRAVPNDAFIKHLEHASEVVRTWPEWKQEILGGTRSQPPAGSSSKDEKRS